MICYKASVRNRNSKMRSCCIGLISRAYNMERLVRFSKKSRELSLSPTLRSPIRLKETHVKLTSGREEDILVIHELSAAENCYKFSNLVRALKLLGIGPSRFVPSILLWRNAIQKQPRKKQWRKAESRREAAVHTDLWVEWKCPRIQGVFHWNHYPTSIWKHDKYHTQILPKASMV